MEDTADVDYGHAKIDDKELNNKSIGDYHDSYVQSDTLLLTDVFENFRNKCIEIYELALAHFFIWTCITMARILNKTGIRFELLKDVDMLLIGMFVSRKRN